MWQALREELHPDGLEVVTVGLDVAGAEACRPYVEAAAPRHPSLIDATHQMASSFGVINVPAGVWIDEQGVIVRPAEPAQPRPSVPERRYKPAAGLPDHMNEILAQASLIPVDTRYVGLVRDWVAHGAASAFALDPDQVVARSGPHDATLAEGQAHFELGAHLWGAGDRDGAVEHWRTAHRLCPDNMAFKRQSWSLAVEGTGFDRFWQGPVPGHEDEWPYESDWLTEVRTNGPERYYPPLDI